MRLRFLLPAAWVVVCSILCPVASYAQQANGGADDVVVDAETEAVIQGALKWLASKQGADGSWFIGKETAPQHPVAMTGYALSALMAAGQLPDEGEYAKNVTAGTRYLLDAVQPDGLFRNVDGSKYMYNHGIATYALSELYGQTKQRSMKPVLERLIQVITSSQNKEGGWRYQPKPADADISVTVQELVALRAAKNAGLEVPQSVIDNGVRYVKSCYDKPSGGFNYMANKSEPGYARTAAAIYSLQVCGLYDDPLVKSGSEFLNTTKDKAWWTYGSFYAAPAQYLVGGVAWRRCYTTLRDELIKTVKREGDLCHWEPAAAGDVGPVYCTAVYIRVLAMPYHYGPLYQR